MPLYSAQQRFTKNDDAWHGYIEWSGRPSATEIVTLDGMLCPFVIDKLIDEDWQHNIHADNMVYFFSEYKYLLERISFDPAKHNILELTHALVLMFCQPSHFTFADMTSWIQTIQSVSC